MLILSDITTRIITQQALITDPQAVKIKKVIGLSGLSSLINDPSVGQRPAVCVAPGQETIEGDTRFAPSFVQQRITALFNIFIYVSASGDLMGDKGITALDAVRQNLFRCLLGWTPDSADQAIEFSGGELMEHDLNSTLWVDTYKTRYTYRTGD